LSFLKSLSYENEGFAFISDPYMFKFTEPAYETSIKTWIKKSKFEKGNRYLQIAYMQCWYHKNESFEWNFEKQQNKFTSTI